jgi:hypothetical protein
LWVLCALLVLGLGLWIWRRVKSTRLEKQLAAERARKPE